MKKLLLMLNQSIRDFKTAQKHPDFIIKENSWWVKIRKTTPDYKEWQKNFNHTLTYG